MLREGDYKLLVYEGYPSRLFNLADDPEELNDLIDVEPEQVATMEQKLATVVDRKETYRLWEDYRKHTFAQFQRQAKRGLYEDRSYSLRKSPSSDYRDLINNAFTGWNEEDEARLTHWLNDDTRRADSPWGFTSGQDTNNPRRHSSQTLCHVFDAPGSA